VTCPIVLLRILLSLAVWHQDADLSPDARAELERTVVECAPERSVRRWAATLLEPRKQ
jgi:hypothetical protein